MGRKLFPSFIISLILLAIIGLSCKKSGNDPKPIPVWEDTGPDSVTFTVTAQTLQGTILVGAYVYLYLSQDSMNKKLMVRPPKNTDGAGKAKFSRLYPRKFWGSCIANYPQTTLRSNFIIYLPPYAVRDTIITLQ